MLFGVSARRTQRGRGWRGGLRDHDGGFQLGLRPLRPEGAAREEQGPVHSQKQNQHKQRPWGRKERPVPGTQQGQGRERSVHSRAGRDLRASVPSMPRPGPASIRLCSVRGAASQRGSIITLSRPSSPALPLFLQTFSEYHLPRKAPLSTPSAPPLTSYSCCLSFSW